MDEPWQQIARDLARAQTAGVLAEVLDERERQHARWGEQNLPGVFAEWAAHGADVLCAEYELPTEALAKERCERAFREGYGTFAHLLVEEVAEAIAGAAVSPERLRAELVQVAAIAVQWVEAIDRRARGGAR